MMNFISRNMAGNKYHNLIMILAIFALFMVGMVLFCGSDVAVDTMRSCAGCTVGL